MIEQKLSTLIAQAYARASLRAPEEITLVSREMVNAMVKEAHRWLVFFDCDEGELQIIMSCLLRVALAEQERGEL